MQATNIIQVGLAYIEENLKADITVEELASIASYSAWHYGRLFVQATGLSVAAYIGKRRLERALAEIVGGRRAIDVALEYGFDTYAGFYKAFVRMYGSSPKRYLKKENAVMCKEGRDMVTEQELREMLANWDVPQGLPILDVHIMDGTQVSDEVWSVGEEYILKVGARETLLKNLCVAKALARQGFAAATPICAKSGAEFLEGDPITVLTRGIQGSPLPKADRFGDNRRLFGCKYGEGIARLHKALAAIEAEVEPQEHNLYDEVIDWAMPKMKQQNAQYRMGLSNGFFEEYTQRFGARFDVLPKQLIHRDPNPSNILFDGGEISGFVDFGLSHRSVRLFDPCYCATGILSEWRGVTHIQEKWWAVLEGVLHGYDSVNPLTTEEKESVFDVICSIQMVFTAYCEQEDGLGALARTNREMLQFIVENQERIANIF